MKRSRLIYFFLTLAVITLGLLSRRYSNFLLGVFGKYPGDALWGLMVFCGIGFLCPKTHAAFAAMGAIIFSCTVEFLKLYHAPWIESLRATLFGRLVLGNVFSWKNIAAYAIGILVGWVMETAIQKCRAERKPLRT